MKPKPFGAFIVAISSPRFIQYFMFFLFVQLFSFALVGGMTALKPQYRPSSSYINQLFDQYQGKFFLFFMEQENHYFEGVLDKSYKSISWPKVFIELAANTNLKDPRTLLGNEIPGFRIYDIKLVMNEKGSNFSNIAYESSPTLDLLLHEKSATNIDLSKDPTDNETPLKKPAITTGGKKVVYIYTTHSRESFKPVMVKGVSVDEAYNSKANVTLVGNKLAKELEKRGIGAIADTTDVTGLVLRQKKTYGDSYDVSKNVILNGLKKNPNIKYVIDIHRDSVPHKSSSIKIGSKAYARFVFIVGGDNAKYEKNLQVATDLHTMLNKKYPGISRNVVVKSGVGVNGKYNQDISTNALLIEIGGVENDLHELYNSCEALSDILTDYYWKHAN